MGFDFRTIKHTCLLSAVAWAGKKRFHCPFFCGKAGRGLLALTAVPSRVRILLEIQEPCNTKGTSVVRFVSALLLAILGVVCLRDESTLSLPRTCDHTTLLQNATALNRTVLGRVNTVTGEGLFKYRYFLSKKDEDTRLAFYDGGKIPTTQIPLHISRPWTKEQIPQNDDITLGDDQVLLHFRQIGANTGRDENVWVVGRANDNDIVQHAQFLGRLIQAEILETAVVLIGVAILAACFGPFGLRLTSLLVLAAVLLFEGTLSWKIWKYFQPIDRAILARDDFAMLHLILCSRAGSILSRKSPLSRSFLPVPAYVEVTMIGRRQQSIRPDVGANANPNQDAALVAEHGAVGSAEAHERISTTQQPLPPAIQVQFKVIAKTLLEIHHRDDVEYGPHFRSATMPYTTAPVFCLTFAHGLFWCLSTTLLPNYNYRKNMLAIIAAVNGLLKTTVPPAGLPWLAGIFVLADTFTQYVGFREDPNLDPRIRPFRDLPQVLPAIGIFGAIYDALKI